MNAPAPEPDRILIHGIFGAPDTRFSKTRAATVRAAREQAFTAQAAALGVHSYEWLDASRRVQANKLLASMRGTAPTVDAVEIITLDRGVLNTVLETGAGRALWREVAACEQSGLDPTRSFILMGAPRQLLEGSRRGQRLLWFGNGLSQLSREQFIAHYTTRHGPLVAGHAQLIGLRSYRQVPDEQDGLCSILRESGMGQASPPAVFAELVMGAPSIRLSTLGAYRAASREIKADEKRHIAFSESMLLVPGS